MGETKRNTFLNKNKYMDKQYEIHKLTTRNTFINTLKYMDTQIEIHGYINRNIWITTLMSPCCVSNSNDPPDIGSG